MSKLTLSDPTNLVNASAIATLTSNNRATEAALEKTLSRDGTSPNEMNADLDMNSKKVLNLPVATSPSEPVRKNEFDVAVFQAITAQSVTTQTIGFGSMTFVIDPGLSFAAGMFILIVDQNNTSNYMSGKITSYVGQNLTVNVTNIGGSGVKSLWYIYLSGAPFQGTTFDLVITVTGGILSSSEWLGGMIFDTPATFAANFGGSYAKAGVAATGSPVIDIKKNGVSCGTITYTGTTGAFSSAGVSFATGDLIEFVAPASPDVTLARISITLFGTRN